MKSLNEEQLKVCHIVNKYSEETLDENLDLIKSYFILLKNNEFCDFLDDVKVLCNFCMILKDTKDEEIDEKLAQIDILFIDKYLNSSIIDDSTIKKILDLFLNNEFNIHRFAQVLKIFSDNCPNFSIEMFRNMFYVFYTSSLKHFDTTNMLYHDIYLKQLEKIEKDIFYLYDHILYNHVITDILNLRNAIKDNKEKFIK